MTAPGPTPTAAYAPTREVIHRHSLIVRITHWINVVCMAALLMSGLQIFNAYPRLHWGSSGSSYDQAAFSIGAADGPGGALRGEVRLGTLVLPTTGVLGVSDVNGEPRVRAFPTWLTLPAEQNLAGGRRWHFFFAWLFVLNGLVYLVWRIGSGGARRDLLPTREDLRGIGRSIVDHVRLRHPTGEAAKRYNVLQKLAYLGVLVALPLMLLTGISMSPGVNAIAPWLLDVFGGRPSARTLHFIAMAALVLFTVVHVVEVFLAGFVNEMRSMITGRYVVPQDRAHR